MSAKTWHERKHYIRDDEDDNENHVHDSEPQPWHPQGPSSPIAVAARLIIAAFVLWAVGSLMLPKAHAQTATLTAPVKITYTLPTTVCTVGITPCDSLPATGVNALTELRIYIRETAIADTDLLTPVMTVPLNVATPPTTATTSFSTTAGKTLYVRLKACNASGVNGATVCSEFSNQGTKVVTVPATKPNTPAIVTFEITINGVTM